MYSTVLYTDMSTNLVSLPAPTDGPVPLGLTVCVAAAGALRAGVGLAPHERVAGVPRRTTADGAVTCTVQVSGSTM